MAGFCISNSPTFQQKTKTKLFLFATLHSVSLRRRIEIFAIPDVVVHQRDKKFGKNGDRRDQNKSPKIHKIIWMMFFYLERDDRRWVRVLMGGR